MREIITDKKANARVILPNMLTLIGVGKTYITAKADLGVDLKKIKPNLFVAVPLVLDVFKDKIVDKLKGLPLLKNFDFSDFKNNNIISLNINNITINPPPS